jgi:hypothetical protein
MLMSVKFGGAGGVAALMGLLGIPGVGCQDYYTRKCKIEVRTDWVSGNGPVRALGRTHSLIYLEDCDGSFFWTEVMPQQDPNPGRDGLVFEVLTGSPTTPHNDKSVYGWLSGYYSGDCGICDCIRSMAFEVQRRETRFAYLLPNHNSNSYLGTILRFCVGQVKRPMGATGWGTTISEIANQPTIDGDWGPFK